MISSKCVLNINLNVIKNNYQELQKKFTGSEVAASVKSDCYGLGAEKIVPVLKTAGCRHFFVASKDEGVKLRRILSNHQDANIYVLNGYFTGDKEDFIRDGFIPVINCLEQLELWQDLAHVLNKKLPCFLHINTGMNRYSMPEYEIEILIKDFYLDKVDILCVMSHLSSSEDPEDSSNIKQLEKFKSLAELFPNAKKSLVNSSGIFLSPEYHFDIARPGGALYGINPVPYLQNSIINNPLFLTAPIIQLNYIKAGEYIGYNRTYQADENRFIATIPLGYGDGYSRSLSNKGVVYINNRPAKVVGRVSMDLTNIDVTDIPEEDLFLGQKVEVIGPNISLDKIANLAGTNGYEFLTMLGDRYEKVYN